MRALFRPFFSFLRLEVCAFGREKLLWPMDRRTSNLYIEPSALIHTRTCIEKVVLRISLCILNYTLSVAILVDALRDTLRYIFISSSGQLYGSSGCEQM
jgi:hypothetical protein